MIEWRNKNIRVDPIIYLETEKKSTLSNSSLSLLLVLTNLFINSTKKYNIKQCMMDDI